MESPITAKAALLQVLIRGPGYGLELINRVKTFTDGRIELGQGSVYPALRDLEREGFVKSYPGEATAERGGRPRIYYKLTAAGQRAAIDDGATLLGLVKYAGAL